MSSAILNMGLIHPQILQMAQIQNKNLRKSAPFVDRGFHTENCYHVIERIAVYPLHNTNAIG